MAEHFASITGFQSKREYPCTGCQGTIQPGDLYILVTVLRKTIRQQTNKWHYGCWLEHFVTRMASLEEHHEAVKNHTEVRKSRLKNLTKEQKYRRQVLQTYISSRDIPALKKAYEQHSTERVIRVMNTLSKRWEEAAQMGVAFKGYLWKDKQLDSYIATYDGDWMNYVFKEDLSLEEQTQALRRTTEDKYLPRWPERIE